MSLGQPSGWMIVALAATVVVLVAPNARAAVPMCGEHAETIAAPPIIMPSKNLVLDRVTLARAKKPSSVGRLGRAASFLRLLETTARSGVARSRPLAERSGSACKVLRCRCPGAPRRVRGLDLSAASRGSEPHHPSLVVSGDSSLASVVSSSTRFARARPWRKCHRRARNLSTR